MYSPLPKFAITCPMFCQTNALNIKRRLTLVMVQKRCCHFHKSESISFNPRPTITFCNNEGKRPANTKTVSTFTRQTKLKQKSDVQKVHISDFCPQWTKVVSSALGLKIAKYWTLVFRDPLNGKC